MPWNYDPKDAKRGLSEGEYEARLADVKDGTSKAGNAMRVITFEVYGPTGNNVRVKDYFVEGQAFAVRKMKELAGAIGREADFQAGTFDAADHLDSVLSVCLIVDDDGWNKIDGYAPSAMKAAKPAAKPAPRTPVVAASRKPGEPLGEDDIPF